MILVLTAFHDRAIGEAMLKREAIEKEISTLCEEGVNLPIAFRKKEDKLFQAKYQNWYSKALKTVASLAPDRYAEFRAYYEIDPKRKSLGYGTYVIQDYLKNVAPNGFHYPDFDTRDQVVTAFFNQITILKSVGVRATSV